MVDSELSERSNTSGSPTGLKTEKCLSHPNETFWVTWRWMIEMCPIPTQYVVGWWVGGCQQQRPGALLQVLEKLLRHWYWSDQERSPSSHRHSPWSATVLNLDNNKRNSRCKLMFRKFLRLKILVLCYGRVPWVWFGPVTLTTLSIDWMKSGHGPLLRLKQTTNNTIIIDTECGA